MCAWFSCLVVSGASLVYSQMYESSQFVSSETYRQHFQTCEADRPLVVQFAGNDAETMVQAGKMVQDRCDGKR